MCDRSRGRSGCTRRRTTTPGQWAVPRVDFRRERVTVATRRGNRRDPEHNCHAPFSRNRVSCAPARSLVLGSPWRSCTEQPHLPRGVAQPPLLHMIATKARAGQCPTPLPDRHARASTTTPRHLPTPGHPWSSCAGRSPVPRAVVWDPVQPRIATAAELSHCPRLSSWRGP